ncbi:MAG: heme NO-binding domain-containing protein [Magnetovibrionaceae bacterium]
MLGIVFTEFLEMVEGSFSPEMADKLLETEGLSTGGVYTAVGNYPHSDMAKMVVRLSEELDVPIPDLLQAFGTYLFGQFVKGYPAFFEGVGSALDFLQGIEERIHTEVRKLYPEAQLPGFTFERPAADHLILHYSSERHLQDLGLGLIKGCAQHFGEKIDVAITDSSTPELAKVQFDLRAQAA